MSQVLDNQMGCISPQIILPQAIYSGEIRTVPSCPTDGTAGLATNLQKALDQLSDVKGATAIGINDPGSSPPSPSPLPSPSCIIYHLSSIIDHLSSDIYHLTSMKDHRSSFIYHLYHLSSILDHQSSTISH